MLSQKVGRDGSSSLCRAPFEHGDEIVGQWTQAQRERMDARFRERMERAIERGLERNPDGEEHAA
jgi:hypothetical protein